MDLNVRSSFRIGRVAFHWLARMLFDNITITRCRPVSGRQRVLRGAIRTAMLAPFLGYFRGDWDHDIAAWIVWVRLRTTVALTHVMVPSLAAVVVTSLAFTVLATVLCLVTCLVVMRLPSYLGAILVWLIGEQQGNWLTSRLQLVVAISLPLSLAVALLSPFLVGVYSLIYFAIATTYVDLAIDPRRVAMLMSRYGMAHGLLNRTYNVLDDAARDAQDDEADREVPAV